MLFEDGVVSWFSLLSWYGFQFCVCWLTGESVGGIKFPSFHPSRHIRCYPVALLVQFWSWGGFSLASGSTATLGSCTAKAFRLEAVPPLLPAQFPRGPWHSAEPLDLVGGTGL